MVSLKGTFSNDVSSLSVRTRARSSNHLQLSLKTFWLIWKKKSIIFRRTKSQLKQTENAFNLLACLRSWKISLALSQSHCRYFVSCKSPPSPGHAEPHLFAHGRVGAHTELVTCAACPVLHHNSPTWLGNVPYWCCSAKGSFSTSQREWQSSSLSTGCCQADPEDCSELRCFAAETLMPTTGIFQRCTNRDLLLSAGTTLSLAGGQASAV